MNSPTKVNVDVVGHPRAGTRGANSLGHVGAQPQMIGAASLRSAVATVLVVTALDAVAVWPEHHTAAATSVAEKGGSGADAWPAVAADVALRGKDDRA